MTVNKATVLIVDADDIHQEMLQNMLEDEVTVFYLRHCRRMPGEPWRSARI